jgi:hypothetical protein
MADNDTRPAHGFFKRLRALDRVTHKDVSIDRNAGYDFARELITAPLVMTDFAPAARDYPIVFIGEPAQPFALFGLRSQRNLLVGHDGQWRKGRYVPSHLRSYPFGYAEAPEQRILMCIDEAAEHLQPEKQRHPQALFIDGQPSPMVQEMLEFLTRLHADTGGTRAFAAAIAAAQLLIERKAEVTLSNGEHLSLDGFRVIDEQKFNALPESTFLEWRARGWLAPIYFHLQSLANLVNLVEWASEEAAG